MVLPSVNPARVNFWTRLAPAVIVPSIASRKDTTHANNRCRCPWFQINWITSVERSRTGNNSPSWQRQNCQFDQLSLQTVAADGGMVHPASLYVFEIVRISAIALMPNPGQSWTKKSASPLFSCCKAFQKIKPNWRASWRSQSAYCEDIDNEIVSQFAKGENYFKIICCRFHLKVLLRFPK